MDQCFYTREELILSWRSNRTLLQVAVVRRPCSHKSHKRSFPDSGLCQALLYQSPLLQKLAATCLQGGVMWRTLPCSHIPASKRFWLVPTATVCLIFYVINMQFQQVIRLQAYKAQGILHRTVTITSGLHLAIFASSTIVHLSTAEIGFEMHFKVSLCHQHALSIFWSTQPGIQFP